MIERGSVAPCGRADAASGAADELTLDELAASNAVRLAKNKARAGFDMMKTPAAL
ncbi:hypothetical protein SBA_ch1_16170 [Sphingomonas bisphenolicum]|uniref:Uncharacterized protein n=1 Tax=Sphingomonas bisphenolicum TaxID=296544 RepID=A0ABN5WB24_9SPHN|nr:hypothetical protein SBA_ch1_16170 [Sphingomonas bisphenolicum]